MLINGTEESVNKAILEGLGAIGWAKASPIFVDVRKDKKEGEIILAIDRKEINNVRSAFELSEENIKVKRVSGTLKGLEK